MRFQLALNVDDLDAAVEYYAKLFGVAVNKREPGYANFVVENPALKLVLFEAPGAERLNHVGFEASDDEVDATAAAMEARGVLAERQEGEVCCYAKQNKAISYDPQGLMWEWYRVLEDSPTFFAEPEPESEAKATAACCAETSGSCC